MSESTGHSGHLTTGSRLGSYLIVRCIGEGGMGTVYEGRHESLGKRVAIKTLHGHGAQSGELVSRFVREGKAAAKINHPNVVDVVDVGVQDGMPYLIMEYLEGKDLAGTLEQHAPMAATPIADLMVPVVSALAAVHEAGIVHRDLKPDNIFITRGKGGAMEPKLVDFGISKVDDAGSLKLTGTNAILGTPYYMSPEQAGSSKEIDHRSDIFSIGVILYQCATHELPFKGDSLFRLLTEIVHADPPPLRSIKPEISEAFEALVLRAMHKDPAQRFQSASALGAALLPFSSTRVRLSYEHEFGAVPASVKPLPRKSASRAPLWIAIGAAVVGLVVLGFLLQRAQQTQPTPAAAADTAEEAPIPVAADVILPSAPTPSTELPAGRIEPIAAPSAAPSAAPTEPTTPVRAASRRRLAAKMPQVGDEPKATKPLPSEAPQPSGPTEDDLFRDRH